MAVTRASDGAPMYVDADYLVANGEYIEIRVKGKIEKNPILILIPDGEFEDRYFIHCDKRQFGHSYRKVTRGGQSVIERDALITALQIVDIPQSSMLATVAQWACSEFKSRVAAREKARPAASEGTDRHKQDAIALNDDALTRFKWRQLSTAIPNPNPNSAASLEVYDAYLGDTAPTGEGGVFLLVSRFNYRSKNMPVGTMNAVEVSLFAVGCESRKLLWLRGITFDPSGNVTGRESAPAESKPSNVQAGTVGQTYFDVICAQYFASAQGSRSVGPATVQSAPKQSPAPAESAAAAPISFGTAWLSDRGYIVTAFHVVDGVDEIVLRSRDGKLYSAKVVASDKPNDIAILSSSISAGLIGLPFARGLPGLGARVFTIGFPHPDVMGVSQKLTSGDVNSLSGIGDDPRLLQISAPVQSGNSGGPLINMNGEIVGMISAKLSATQVQKSTGDLTQNVNYAVKARYVSGLLDDLAPRVESTSASRTSRSQSLEQLATGAQEAIFLVVGR